MIVDLSIIAVIALCTFIGYKKGLMHVAFKLMSTILAIIIAVIVYNPISSFIINNTEIYLKIEQVVEQNIDVDKLIKDKQENKENVSSEIWGTYIEQSLQETVNNTKETIENSIVEKISTLILNAAVLIIVFIVVKLSLGILNLIIDIISKLPIISQFNQLGGIVCGALEGLLIVYVILAICLVTSSLLQETGIINEIYNSNIGKLMYTNNILLKLIG